MTDSRAIGCYALVPAAGSGVRMGGSAPKQYLPLLGRPLIWHAIAALCRVPAIAKVYVVLSPDDGIWNDGAFADFQGRLAVLRCGGATRAESVANGLATMRELLPVDDLDAAWILVHDAARPCLNPLAVERLIAAVVADDDGGILALPVADTLKRADGMVGPPRIGATVDRAGLWQAQTPQMFRYGLLRRALAEAPAVTDEASACEAIGLRPRLVEGDVTNLKVTYPGDLALADLVLRARGATT